MAKKSDVYNLNAIRPALQEAWKRGNRQPISKTMCAEQGISEVHFNMYYGTLEKLYKVVSEYSRIKNSPAATDTQRTKAMNEIYPVWKELLGCSEKEQSVRDLHASEHDISNLVGFCQRFVNNANNTKFEDDFQAQRVWAVEAFRAFQKSVETDLGIRIAGIEVLSDAQRDFLRAESSLLNKIKKAEQSKKDKLAEIDGYKKQIKVFPEAKAAFDDLIGAKQEEISALEAKIAGAQQKYKELLAANENPKEVSAKTPAQKKPAVKKKAPAMKKSAVKPAEKVSAKSEATPVQSTIPVTEVSAEKKAA